MQFAIMFCLSVSADFLVIMPSDEYAMDQSVDKSILVQVMG